MIIADFECPSGHITEHPCHPKQKKAVCRCGKKAKRIISFGSVYTANQDTPWVRSSAAALLDPETSRTSADPVERNLALHPNRENLAAFMKTRNLRIVENERGGPPVYQRPPNPDMSMVKREVWEKHRARKAIEVRS